MLIEYRRASEQVTSAQSPLALVPQTPILPHPVTGPILETDKASGPDWLAWFMGALAIMMIAGLVPVWMLVSQRYSVAQAPPTPSPFIMPTPSPTLILDIAPKITVPNVIGLGQEDARQFLEANNLKFAVVGERHDSDIPPLHVVAQTIAAGQEVSKGEVVGVILSQGPRFINIPNVVGLPADSVEPGLVEIGLRVARIEIWSAEPAGIVITQEPLASTLVAEGSTVTMTVSTGARLPLNANLGDQVMLVAAEMERIEVEPGSMLSLTLHWRALAQMGTPYIVFVHLVRADGNIIAQLDTQPRNGSYPTTLWQVGEQVRDSYVFLIPEDTPPGSYWIKVGMYTPDTGPRLPVIDPGTAQIENDSIIVREFRVVKED